MVLAKWFLHNAKHDKLGEVAFVGLIQSSVVMEGASYDATTTCGVFKMDLARSASDQGALECMLPDFTDVFEKPGLPPKAHT